MYRQASMSPPDPLILNELANIGFGYRNIVGRSIRIAPINPAHDTLVLISAGQSLRANTSGALYTPTNAANIDNFNIYDGAGYDCAGPMFGATEGGALGVGNIMPRVADLLITNGKFDRVILATAAIGGTKMAEWALGGPYENRISILMRRLAARGIVPGMTGVTFALEWGLGESDMLAGTSQASYEASWASFKALTLATGFSGRFFVALESYYTGSISTAVRAAQAAVVDGVTVFQSGDIDTLNSGNRQDDLHLNPTGAAAAATLIYNAMVASGAPF